MVIFTYLFLLLLLPGVLKAEDVKKDPATPPTASAISLETLSKSSDDELKTLLHFEADQLTPVQRELDEVLTSIKFRNTIGSKSLDIEVVKSKSIPALEAKFVDFRKELENKVTKNKNTVGIKYKKEISALLYSPPAENEDIQQKVMRGKLQENIVKTQLLKARILNAYWANINDLVRLRSILNLDTVSSDWRSSFQLTIIEEVLSELRELLEAAMNSANPLSKLLRFFGAIGVALAGQSSNLTLIKMESLPDTIAYVFGIGLQQVRMAEFDSRLLSDKPDDAIFDIAFNFTFIHFETERRQLALLQYKEPEVPNIPQELEARFHTLSLVKEMESDWIDNKKEVILRERMAAAISKPGAFERPFLEDPKMVLQVMFLRNALKDEKDVAKRNALVQLIQKAFTPVGTLLADALKKTEQQGIGETAGQYIRFWPRRFSALDRSTIIKELRSIIGIVKKDQINRAVSEVATKQLIALIAEKQKLQASPAKPNGDLAREIEIADKKVEWLNLARNNLIKILDDLVDVYTGSLPEHELESVISDANHLPALRFFREYRKKYVDQLIQKSKKLWGITHAVDSLTVEIPLLNAALDGEIQAFTPLTRQYRDQVLFPEGLEESAPRVYKKYVALIASRLEDLADTCGVKESPPELFDKTHKVDETNANNLHEVQVDRLKEFLDKQKKIIGEIKNDKKRHHCETRRLTISQLLDIGKWYGIVQGNYHDHMAIGEIRGLTSTHKKSYQTQAINLIASDTPILQIPVVKGIPLLKKDISLWEKLAELNIDDPDTYTIGDQWLTQTLPIQEKFFNDAQKNLLAAKNLGDLIYILSKSGYLKTIIDKRYHYLSAHEKEAITKLTEPDGVLESISDRTRSIFLFALAYQILRKVEPAAVKPIDPLISPFISNTVITALFGLDTAIDTYLMMYGRVPRNRKHAEDLFFANIDDPNPIIDYARYTESEAEFHSQVKWFTFGWVVNAFLAGSASGVFRKPIEALGNWWKWGGGEITTLYERVGFAKGQFSANETVIVKMAEKLRNKVSGLARLTKEQKEAIKLEIKDAEDRLTDFIRSRIKAGDRYFAKCAKYFKNLGLDPSTREFEKIAKRYREILAQFSSKEISPKEFKRLAYSYAKLYEAFQIETIEAAKEATRLAKEGLETSKAATAKNIEADITKRASSGDRPNGLSELEFGGDEFYGSEPHFNFEAFSYGK